MIFHARSYNRKRYILIGVFLAAGGGHGVATAESPFFEESDVNVYFTLLGEQPGDWFGWVAEDLGDINGDGISDIFIGDFNAFQEENGTGRAYVFSGLNGNRLSVMNAESSGDGLGPGRLVSDVDGDGRDDIFVAAYTWGDNAEGKAYLRSGRGGVIRTMTGTEPTAFLGVDAAGLSDVNDDGKLDFILTGNGVIHVITGN